MPAPRFRSRSMKRRLKKTPGGRKVIHYERGKLKLAHCANCGKQLGGVPSLRIGKMKKLSKTQKRPQRIFGGVLCPKCVKDKIKETVK